MTSLQDRWRWTNLMKWTLMMPEVFYRVKTMPDVILGLVLALSPNTLILCDTSDCSAKCWQVLGRIYSVPLFCLSQLISARIVVKISRIFNHGSTLWRFYRWISRVECYLIPAFLWLRVFERRHNYALSGPVYVCNISGNIRAASRRFDWRLGDEIDVGTARQTWRGWKTTTDSWRRGMYN
jgi:hypothetical protein